MADALASAAEPRPTGDPLWDDWDTPLRVPATPMLHLDGFDGPMDLLLDLADRQRIDLGRISVVALVEQFLAESARFAHYVPVERRAEWLVLAARLVLLRSRLLFPASPAAAEDADHEAEREVARLHELRLVRAAATWLAGRPRFGHDVFARPQGPDPRAASYMALMEACLAGLRGREEQAGEVPLYRPPLATVFRVEDALARMRPLVAEMTVARPLAAFLPRLTEAMLGEPVVVRSAVASTLIAALELCREAVVGLQQTEALGPIMVSPRMTQATEAGT
jgi:segregation and condensation protein A